MNFIFYNKKNLFILIGLLTLLFILLSIQLLSAPLPGQVPSPSIAPSASPQTQNNLPSLPPTEDSPTSSYEIDKLNQDYQRIINRQPVSSSDQALRKKLIDSLGNQTGVLNQSANFKIEYVKAPDAFMIEILSNNTEAAKSSAQNWFKQQGLSDSGICNLPIVFYLSRSVNTYLNSNDIQFDPTPKGCQ